MADSAKRSGSKPGWRAASSPAIAAAVNVMGWTHALVTSSHLEMGSIRRSEGRVQVRQIWIQLLREVLTTIFLAGRRWTFTVVTLVQVPSSPTAH